MFRRLTPLLTNARRNGMELSTTGRVLVCSRFQEERASTRVRLDPFKPRNKWGLERFWKSTTAWHADLP
jgi:hypothetical protein